MKPGDVLTNAYYDCFVKYLGDSSLSKGCFIGKDMETGEVHDDWLKRKFFMEGMNK